MTNNKYQHYPQISRIFRLQKISVERCKAEFEHCYHFKKFTAQECGELAKRLETGIDLIEELKNTGAQLTKAQKQRFKMFRNGARFLISQFDALAAHVEAVEKGEFEPTSYNPYQSTTTTENDAQATTEGETGGATMKSKHAKQFLRPQAVAYYLAGGALYTFMSLYDDNEPYPISEVIELQRENVAKIKMELGEALRKAEGEKINFTVLGAERFSAEDKAEFLTRELDKAETALKRLLARKKKGGVMMDTAFKNQAM